MDERVSQNALVFRPPGWLTLKLVLPAWAGARQLGGTLRLTFICCDLPTIPVMLPHSGRSSLSRCDHLRYWKALSRPIPGQHLEFELLRSAQDSQPCPDADLVFVQKAVEHIHALHSLAVQSND